MELRDDKMDNVPLYTADVRGVPAKIYLKGQALPIAEVQDRKMALRITACLNECSDLSNGALSQHTVMRSISLVRRIIRDHPYGVFEESGRMLKKTATGIDDDLGLDIPDKER